MNFVVVPESLSVQDLPLPDEVRMVLVRPTATNIGSSLLPYVIPLSFFDVGEVREVHVVPFDEVKIVPDSPTVTNVLIERVHAGSIHP